MWIRLAQRLGDLCWISGVRIHVYQHRPQLRFVIIGLDRGAEIQGKDHRQIDQSEECEEGRGFALSRNEEQRRDSREPSEVLHAKMGE